MMKVRPGFQPSPLVGEIRSVTDNVGRNAGLSAAEETSEVMEIDPQVKRWGIGAAIAAMVGGAWLWMRRK